MATLWWVMLWVSVVIFAGVMVLLVLAYRAPALLRRLSPTGWIIAGGIAMPVPVLIVLTGASLALGEHLQPRDATRTVEVTAERWAWRFRYDETIVSTNELHLPVGEPVRLEVTGADVIHGFWIPRLGPKIDAIPGHRNIVVVEADRPGTYRGVCAEYCGEGHDVMYFTVIAHEPSDYDSALAGLQ